MATVTKPIALDESFNTTELTPRNIADVLAQELSRITGRNASQVEYDNTESGLTADNVQDALDEINGKIPTVPSVDIQTAVDEFSTYNGGILDSLKVALSPNQDLHGYSEPWAGGAGKNKFNDTTETHTINANTDVTIIIGDVYLEANTAYTISCKQTPAPLTSFVRNTLLVVGGGTTTYNPAGNDYTIKPMTFTPTVSDIYSIRIWGHTLPIDTSYSEFQVEKGSTATAYEPYENICPISGHTQVDVDVSDGDTTQEQITVNLGGTYYSGTLDVVTGVFTPDTASDDLGSLTWQTRYTGSVNKTLSSSLSQKPLWAETEGEVQCEDYKYNGKVSGASQLLDPDNCEVGLYLYYESSQESNAKVCYLVIPVDNSPDDKVVYELNDTIPIQLSPTMVEALVGDNHLSAPLEGQEITESKYRELFTWDEVEAYVNAHSGGGSGMNYSTNEQVIGTWIDSKPLYQKTIDFGALPNGNTKDLSHGIANIDKVWISGGFAYQPNGDFANQLSLCVPTSLSAGWYFGVNSSIVRCETASDRTNYSAYVTIQYTKTTD